MDKATTTTARSENLATKFSVNVNAHRNAKDKRPDSANSEITVKEFLDFLKTAYQVNQSLEGVLLAEGMTETVDWIKLKESELVKPHDVAVQTSETKLKEEKKDVERKRPELFVGDPAEPVKRKLSGVLTEGLLDSVLPYLVSQSQSRRTLQQKFVPKVSSMSQASSSGEQIGRRKSNDSGSKISITKTDSEVIIHVCDEVKNTKKDFVCNQRILVEKMGYFAEITAGQRLEDMDISVHCDIGIFEWLMRWVKREQCLEEDWPQLDPQCVIPVLVSAAFLQMEPLLQDCLLFCHRHMNEILRTSTNLSCLNDSVLTSLAAMYTNVEVESIRDRKDKIQSRLYCKLIQSLCEPESESVRGHWNSFAYVFQCNFCKQLICPTVSRDIPCNPQRMRLEADGSVSNHHLRDPSWNVNEYIEKLHKSLRSWRRVYWRLWSDCHFLYCSACSRPFPAHQIGWCRFHPDPPQFFTLDAQKAPLPVGRFPCCGERAYRFQLLHECSGCRFREHTPCTESVQDAAVYSMLEAYRTLIEEQPPQLMFPERLTRLVARDASNIDGKLASSESFWWEGLELVPPRPKLGLLSTVAGTVFPAEPPESPEEEEYSDVSDNTSTDSASTTPGSEESLCKPFVPKTGDTPPVTKQKVGKKRVQARLWQQNLSARSNQDIQRSYEEQALKHIATILGRRTFSSNNSARGSFKTWPRHSTPPGGIWTRLEAEWREAHTLSHHNQPQRMRNIYTGKLKIKPARLQ